MEGFVRYDWGGLNPPDKSGVLPLEKPWANDFRKSHFKKYVL